jgi:hypothetical protein
VGVSIVQRRWTRLGLTPVLYVRWTNWDKWRRPFNIGGSSGLKVHTHNLCDGTDRMQPAYGTTTLTAAYVQ